MPAHAVPCPAESPVVEVSKLIRLPSTRASTDSTTRPLRSGCEASIPLSMIATLTPRPVARRQSSARSRSLVPRSTELDPSETGDITSVKVKENWFRSCCPRTAEQNQEILYRWCAPLHRGPQFHGRVLRGPSFRDARSSPAAPGAIRGRQKRPRYSHPPGAFRQDREIGRA